MRVEVGGQPLALHEVLDGGLDLGDMGWRMVALADDYAEFGEAGLTRGGDGAFSELDGFLDVETVEVDRAARLGLVVLVEDPAGRLVVVLVLKALVLLALN